MSNFVLSRVESFKIGAVGALEAACVEVGSAREAETTWTAERRYARSTALKNARVEADDDAADVNIRVVCEEITRANLAYASGGAISGDSVRIVGTGGAPDYFTIYAHGQSVEGEPVVMHVPKAAIRPEGGLTLGTEQQVLEMQWEVFDDGTTGYLVDWTPSTTDTTAPTVSTVNPADAATGVARSSSVVVTFSEAIRSADISDKSVYVFADGAATNVAGTLSVGVNNTQVTFTPSATLAATTKFNVVVVKGIRDTAGNALAATSITEFTTGS